MVDAKLEKELLTRTARDMGLDAGVISDWYDLWSPDRAFDYTVNQMSFLYSRKENKKWHITTKQGLI